MKADEHRRDVLGTPYTEYELQLVSVVDVHIDELTALAN